MPLHGPDALTNRQSGYSLIEILVSMAIMSLAVAIIVPNAVGMVTRFERLTQRSEVLDTIAQCRRQAVVSNEVISLAGLIGAPDEASGEVSCLVVPDGWQVQFDEALIYSPAGVCRGSSLRLIAPDGAEELYRLDPDSCAIVPAET